MWTQVVHGCRQLVSWDVGLSPATSATLVFICHHLVGYFKETAGDKPEEGEDDVKSACPLRSGLHTCYNGYDKKLQACEGKLIYKHSLSSDCRLKLAYMKVESLVIAGQLYGGESVPGPCTHRPSHHGSWPRPKLLPYPITGGVHLRWG